MEDRLKFRAYIKELNELLPVQYINPLTRYVMCDREDGSQEFKSFNRVEIMQCTGLTDKNGKLIYEGDIVRLTNTKNAFEEIRQVVYKDCAFQFNEPNSMQIDRPLYCFAINYLNRYKHIELEVIGNIYENPELCKDGE